MEAIGVGPGGRGGSDVLDHRDEAFHFVLVMTKLLQQRRLVPRTAWSCGWDGLWPGELVEVSSPDGMEAEVLAYGEQVQVVLGGDGLDLLDLRVGLA